MRVIKFRAWDAKYKKMHYKVVVGNVHEYGVNYTAHAVWLLPGDVDYKIKDSGQWMNFDENGDFELMQFTGLTDKNGKEIYEGDICKTYNIDESLFLFDIVVFDNGSFLFTNPNKLSVELRGFKQHYIEVIGNIYENPELIK